MQIKSARTKLSGRFLAGYFEAIELHVYGKENLRRQLKEEQKQIAGDREGANLLSVLYGLQKAC